MSTTTPVRPDSAPKNISLLIVDDETDFRESACRYFNRVGFKVDQAEDGEEALNVSTNKVFDVVVLDIHMPGINGMKVLEELMKRNTRTQGHHVDRRRYH